MKKVASKNRVSGNGNFALTDAVVKWTRAHQEEMARLLAELVAIPTENPPGKNYPACAAILEKQLRTARLACKRYRTEGLAGRSNNSRDNAVCLQGEWGRGERTLHFHGHYDVVPAQSAAQFKPLRKKHVLFGRGSCDMKSGIVAMLYAIRALKECGATLNGRIALTLVPDEETGGQQGAAWLAKRGLLGRGGIGMLTAEPTSGVVWNANRGAITLRVEVLGKSAHVGLQYKGENAFERMHQVVERLLELKRQVEQQTTTHPVGAEGHTGSSLAEGARKARHSILLLGGQSGGGANFNVVPEKCWFTLDRRINPEEDLEVEKQRIIEVLNKCKQVGIPLEWEILQEGRSSACSENEVLGKALAKSIQMVTGNAPRFEMCPGLLEIRFYAAKNIPAYAYGPGLLSVAHGPNEYVDLRRVADCAAIYALTAMEMLAAGQDGDDIAKDEN
jgi:acetylornithine deacetylase/succinyl-diaminopimelate desuccinylase family protein